MILCNNVMIAINSAMCMRAAMQHGVECKGQNLGLQFILHAWRVTQIGERGDVLATEVRGHSSTAPNAALHAGQLL